MKIKITFQIFSLRRAFSLAILCIAAVVQCSAQGKALMVENLNAKTAKESKISYLDLIRKIFPDARIEPDANNIAVAANSIPLRHLFGKGEKRFDGGESLTMDITRRLETIDGRGRVLWLLVNVARPIRPDCEDCTEKVLAAFRVSSTNAELIDAARILTGFDAGFDGELPILKIAPDREAIVLWNFAYTYLEGDALSVITIDHQNKFGVLIRQFEVGRNYRWDCDKWYEEDALVTLAKAARAGFRDIAISVETKGGSGEYDFPKVKTVRRFGYLFRWQPGTQKYEAVINPEVNRRALVKRIAPACPDGSRAVPINPK